MSLDKKIEEKINQWLNGNYDEQTKQTIRELVNSNPDELTEAFYKNLEFGTGGLRGIMGVGTNRMNVYTVGMATQGLANYLKTQFPNEHIKVAISYDNRNNNITFANAVADIFSANGFTVYIFSEMRPTPELSFAIRDLKCQSGVMITASHNPKEYNGYKAYWNDGAQVVAPHDEAIIKEVEKISSIEQVQWKGDESLIIKLGKDMDEKYIQYVKSLSLSPEAVKEYSDLKIVYTPIHGTGGHIMPETLKAYGFENILPVKEQLITDGNFPTVAHPNPEDPAAMKMAIKLAELNHADLVMASDPDADRIAVGIRDKEGKIMLLNGNQTACILTYYILLRHKELGLLKGNEFIVKTIVTSNLMSDIATSFGVEYFNVLTGFKWIAAVIREYEGKKKYLCGGEESYGFMIGDQVRDKDSISAGAMFAEAMAWARSNGSTMYDLLIDIYMQYGLYYEGLVNINKYGISGAEEIKEMMSCFRNSPHTSINGSKVVAVYDYLKGVKTDTLTGKTTPIHLPKSDVLQYETEDRTLVSMRPSGTEPKIKFYISVREELHDRNEFTAVEEKAKIKIEAVKKALGI